MHKVAALLAVCLAACTTSPGPGFAPGDRAEIESLEEAYRIAWVANDSAAVMATLASDAVLMPAGVEPLSGAAIRDFWWPDDGSETTIESYRITIDEIEGSGDLAYLRGRASLTFTYRDPSGSVDRVNSDAAHLSVARRDEQGEWRIIRRSWSSLQ